MIHKSNCSSSPENARPFWHAYLVDKGLLWTITLDTNLMQFLFRKMQPQHWPLPSFDCWKLVVETSLSETVFGFVLEPLPSSPSTYLKTMAIGNMPIYWFNKGIFCRLLFEMPSSATCRRANWQVPVAGAVVFKPTCIIATCSCNWGKRGGDQCSQR